MPSSQGVPSATDSSVHPICGSHAAARQGLSEPGQTRSAPAHLPERHTSSVVHASPSSQAVSSSRGVCAQPFSGSQAAAVHGLSSAGHSMAMPAQAPPPHTSWSVQRLLSSHAVPSATSDWPHPFTASQEAVVHALLSSGHSTAGPAHCPAWQASSVVHAFPSSHAVPSATGA